MDVPCPVGSVKLAGFVAVWRIRVDRFRIIYEVDDEERRLMVLRVFRRDERTYRRYDRPGRKRAIAHMGTPAGRIWVVISGDCRSGNRGASGEYLILKVVSWNIAKMRQCVAALLVNFHHL